MASVFPITKDDYYIIKSLMAAGSKAGKGENNYPFYLGLVKGPDKPDTHTHMHMLPPARLLRDTQSLSTLSFVVRCESSSMDPL